MPIPETEDLDHGAVLSINGHPRKIVIEGDDVHRKENELGVFPVLTLGIVDGQDHNRISVRTTRHTTV